MASSRSLDNAYQCLFDVCVDIITQYNKCSESDVGGGVPDLNPKTVEHELLAYKEKYDKTSPDIHVDVACELYASAKSSIDRGYLCNSWLKEESSCLYYGESVDKCDGRILRLDKIFSMLEYLRRSIEKFSEPAAILRNRFFCNLYKVFLETQKTNNTTTEGHVDNSLSIKTLEERIEEIVNDLPKIQRRPAAGGAGGGGGLASLFGGSGLTDIVDKLKVALPDVVKMAAEMMEKTTGETMSAQDKQMAEQMVSKLSDPEGMQKLLSSLGGGNGGSNFASLFQQMMPQPPTQHGALKDKTTD